MKEKNDNYELWYFNRFIDSHECLYSKKFQPKTDRSRRKKKIKAKHTITMVWSEISASSARFAATNYLALKWLSTVELSSSNDGDGRPEIYGKINFQKITWAIYGHSYMQPQLWNDEKWYNHLFSKCIIMLGTLWVFFDTVCTPLGQTGRDHYTVLGIYFRTLLIYEPAQITNSFDSVVAVRLSLYFYFTM